MKKYMFEIEELLFVAEYGDNEVEARAKIINRIEKGEFRMLDPVVSDGELIGEEE